MNTKDITYIRDCLRLIDAQRAKIEAMLIEDETMPEPETIEEIEQEIANDLEPAGIVEPEPEQEPEPAKEVTYQELVKDTGFYAAFSDWKALHGALKFVSQAINKRGTLPILQHVYLSGHGDYVKILATDLEVGITTSISASNAIGSITIAPGPLCDMLKALKPASIVIAWRDETSVTVVLDGSSQIMPSFDAKEFPALPPMLGNTLRIVGLDSKQAKELQTVTIPAVLPFASTDTTTRPELAGILAVVGNQVLELVATDGSRLAHAVIDTNEECKAGEYCIPASALKILTSVKDLEYLTIHAVENERIYFSDGDQFTICSRLIRSKFPNWKVVIPANDPEVVKQEYTLDTASMSKALACLKPAIAKGKYAHDSKRIDCTFTSDGIAIQAGNIDDGKITQKLYAMPKTPVDSELVSILLNHAFLSDVIASAPVNGSIVMQYTGDMRPVVFRPPGGDNDCYFSIVMPMRGGN